MENSIKQVPKIAKMKNLFLIIVLSFLFQIGYSQEIIEIENPSYEGVPRHNSIPEEWRFCNFSGQSPPDIQPGSFGVSHAAFDGHTYAGIVSRLDGTFEILQKKLAKPLVEGTCYSWSFYMSQSPDYLSISRVTFKDEQFVFPVNVVIYGGKTVDCKAVEPLAIARNIRGLKEWKRYKFVFNAKEAYEYIVIAVEPVNLENPTNGHILLDYFTPLIPVDCGTKKTKDIIVQQDSDLLKDINAKKGEDRLKALIEKININNLTKNGYLNYQFYANEKKKLIYDNIYFNELMKAFPKGNEKEIILMTKDKFERNQFMKYLKSYIEQKELNANFLMLPFKKRLLGKYKESHTLLFEGKDVMIFVK